jgi:N6-L-threonylcarbamoyladenine synthase
MLCLGIETSCDETSCAVVSDGRHILSNVIASQVSSHAVYGGVVPELASRLHISNIVPILKESLFEAGVSLREIDLVGVTSGPGLIGSLLVGVEFAKALAYALGKPLVPVHHVAAHLYAPFLLEKESGATTQEFDYPYLGLVVSGGHSSLVYVHDPLHYEVIGRTLDDAAGEAFDKVAKLLGLGYPGGPIIDRLSHEWNAGYINFPRPGVRSEDCDLSFSGLKTAVVRYVREKTKGERPLDAEEQKHIAASFQTAVIDTLLTKSERAIVMTGAGRVAIVGGVACNTGLRDEARRRLDGITFHIPSPILCTDNAAMVAGLAWHVYHAESLTRPTPPKRLRRLDHSFSDGARIATLTLNADANLPIA